VGRHPTAFDWVLASRSIHRGGGCRMGEEADRRHVSGGSFSFRRISRDCDPPGESVALSWVFLRRGVSMKKRPNQALQPTRVLVSFCADAQPAPSTRVADL